MLESSGSPLNRKPADTFEPIDLSPLQETHMDDKLKFSANEQNALAKLCEMMASASYKLNVQNEVPDASKLQDVVIDIADRFPSIKWGHLYDKFHRQGVNR